MVTRVLSSFVKNVVKEEIREVMELPQGRRRQTVVLSVTKEDLILSMEAQIVATLVQRRNSEVQSRATDVTPVPKRQSKEML
jgi:hypothetical protein